MMLIVVAVAVAVVAVAVDSDVVVVAAVGCCYSTGVIGQLLLLLVVISQLNCSC